MNCDLKKNRNKRACNVGEGSFSIVIPKRDNLNRPIKPKLIQKYIKGMNNIFGGTSTIPRLEGCVIDEKGRFQCEQSIQIVGIRDWQNPYDKLYGTDLSKLSASQKKNKLKKDWKEVKKLSDEAKIDFGQESILAIDTPLTDAYLSFQQPKPKKAPNENIGKNIIFP